MAKKETVRMSKEEFEYLEKLKQMHEKRKEKIRQYQKEHYAKKTFALKKKTLQIYEKQFKNFLNEIEDSTIDSLTAAEIDKLAEDLATLLLILDKIQKKTNNQVKMKKICELILKFAITQSKK